MHVIPVDIPVECIYIYTYIICTYIYISHVFYVLLASIKFIAIGYEKFCFGNIALNIFNKVL